MKSNRDNTRTSQSAAATAAANAARWCENVIIADANYIDNVAFDLIVNFERIIGRRINKADTALWLDCVALDGGLRPGNNATVSVVLIYDKDKPKLDNFAPGDLVHDLHSHAFKSNIGEFTITAVPVEKIVSKEELLEDVLLTAVNHGDVKRVMMIADDESMLGNIKRALRDTPEGKIVTVFTMQPSTVGPFRQEILGYSLMQALGIKGDEIG